MTAHAHQKFFSPRTGPTSGLPSGENVKGPFDDLSVPAFSKRRKMLEPNLQRRRDGGRGRGTEDPARKSHGVAFADQGVAAFSYVPSSSPPRSCRV